jgi:hypothetical protein
LVELVGLLVDDFVDAVDALDFAGVGLDACAVDLAAFDEEVETVGFEWALNDL